MLVLRQVDIESQLVLEAVSSLITDSFGPDSFTGGRYKLEPTGHWWIAFDGKQAAAFAGMRASVRWERVGYLCLAGVLPAYRGQGLQKRLIRARLAKAKELKWTAVLSDTINDNPHSMNSLISCGFRPYTPAIPWGVAEAVYWRKAL